MELIDLILLNDLDDDKIMIVDDKTKKVILNTSCLSDDIRQYFYKEVTYIGVSNDLGINLLVFIER